jgi:hypothetical protein
MSFSVVSGSAGANGTNVASVAGTTGSGILASSTDFEGAAKFGLGRRMSNACTNPYSAATAAAGSNAVAPVCCHAPAQEAEMANEQNTSKRIRPREW